MTPPNDDKDAEEQDHSYTADENVNGIVSQEIRLAVSYKTKHAIPI